jgi:hypothetical protein
MRNGGTIMKTNRIMDEIRGTISPEMKLQMEMSVAIASSSATTSSIVWVMS